MEAQAARQYHPLVITAAIAVTLFSLAGIAAIFGWIPTSVGGGATAQAPAQPEPVKQAEEKHAVKPKPIEHRAVVPPPPPPVRVAAICKECAVIEEVREVEKAGQTSGGGAVGGAVVGGVIGHQIGGGRAGNQIEKNAKTTKEYQIFVRYEDGTKGMFAQPTPPSWRIGDKVKVINGAIQARG